MSGAPVRALLLLGCLALTGSAAAAPPDVELKRARDRFEYGDYQDAARLSDRLIEEGRLTSDDQLIEAYRLLGLSYYYLRRHDEARSALVRLLSVDPDYRLDPFFHPPKLVEFFDRVKADNEALLAPIREQKKRIEEERRRAEEARLRLLDEERRRRQEAEAAAASERKTVVVERTVSNHEYLVNWVPFGAGQFQNGDLVKGSVLAGTQAVTAAASVLGFVVAGNLRRCDPVSVPKGAAGEPDQTGVSCGIPPESQNLAENMVTVKWVAGGLFWALVTYGIIDAHLGFEPVVVLSESRQEIAAETPSRPRPAAAPETGPEPEPSPDAEPEPLPDAAPGPAPEPGPDAPPEPPPAPPAPAEPGPTPASEPTARVPPALQPATRLHLSPWIAPDGVGAFITLEF